MEAVMSFYLLHTEAFEGDLSGDMRHYAVITSKYAWESSFQTESRQADNVK